MNTKPITRFPLRILISLPFVLLIILVVTVVGYLSFHTGKSAVNKVSAELRQTIYEQILQHLDNFLETPHKVNLLNDSYIRLSKLDLSDPITLQNYFLQQLRLFDSVNYIYFANTDGGIILVARRADGSIVVREAENFLAGRSTVYAITDEGRRGNVLEKRKHYDARERPWYKKAEEAGGSAWSIIYPFFLDKALGITAALPVYTEDGELKGILATDILLSHIQNFLGQLTEGGVGEVFILETSGWLVASSTSYQTYRQLHDTNHLIRINAKDISSPLIRTAHQQLVERFGDLNEILDSTYLEFDLDGQRQFLQVNRYQDARGLDWLITIAVPEAVFMDKIVANTHITIVLCLTALIVAVLLSIFLAKWISHPLSNLKQAAASLAKGNWTQQLSRNRVEELDTLSGSFNTMAKQLQTFFYALSKKNIELKKVQRALTEVNYELERRVKTRTIELSESEERYKRLAQASFEGVVIHSDGVIIDCNKAIEEIFGYQRVELKGRNLLELVVPESNQAVVRWIASPASKPFEVMAEKKSGELITLGVRSTSTPYNGKQVSVAVMRDISERKRNEKHLRFLATTDSLTQVPNRRHFQELAQSEISKSKRFQHELSFLLLDIDHFKRINDTYGHGMGDEVIKKLAATCKSRLRDIDIIGRMGGEEFAIMLPETDGEGALVIAELLRSTIANTPFDFDGHKINVTISIGLACFNQTNCDLDNLFKQADMRLYKAKHGGRNCTVAI